MKKILIIALSGVLFTSCIATKSRTVTNRTIKSSYQNIVIKPLVADVSVDITKKITGSATVKNGNVEQAKDLAKWNAIETSGADIIVDPIYDVTVSGITVDAKVVGFFGKYEKIETISDADLEKLELYQINTKNKEASVVNKLEKLKMQRAEK